MPVLQTPDSTVDGVSEAFARTLLDAFLLAWPIWLAIGLLAVGAIIVGVVRRVVRRRRFLRSGIADIDRFGGETFEQYLTVLFRELGYRVERTRFRGDYGGDLVVQRNGVRTVVQAKRYSKSVGVKAVQEAFTARAEYDCGEAMVVSNSHYTRQAIHLARKAGVVLWDRDDLIRNFNAVDATNRLGEGDTAPANTPAPSTTPLADVASCGTCARVLSAAERRYCETNAVRFDGRMLCFQHQRSRQT